MITQVLIAIDQLFNTLLFGWADETLSARTWRNSKNSKWWEYFRIVIDTLFFFQPQHCFSSYLNEFTRKQLPDEYRK